MNEAQVRAAELLAQEYDYGWGAHHAHKVADLAVSLFDQLEREGLLPELSEENRRTLAAAAYLHDIGDSPRARLETPNLPRWARAPMEHERHGELGFHLLRARLLSTSPDRPLSTLSPMERSMLLYCLLWHAAVDPYVVDVEPLFDHRKALLLAGLLRIADGLDCEHRLRVREVRVQKASAWLRLLVYTSATASAEVVRAREKSGFLGHTLGLRFFIQEVLQ